MMETRRERVPACIHPETYRYHLDPTRAGAVWDACGTRFGPWRKHSTLPIRELHCDAFVLRAPDRGTPVTVLRKSACSTADLRLLHELFSWRAELEGEATA